MTIEIRDFEERDHEWADRLIGGFQGGDRRVARLGELIDPLTRQGIVAERDGRPVGLLIVNESERGLEALTLNVEAADRGIGVGTRLLETSLRVAVASGSPRLWLVTTNENLAAIRFYLGRGMRVVRVHFGGVARDRESLKPDMPAFSGETGIALRDYVELELATADGDALQFPRFPRMADIDALPPEAAADALGPLFEHAPRFLIALAGERPFGDDATLFERAHEVARMLPEGEQIELLDGHPRIGADPTTVSELSRTEQGYDDGTDGVSEEGAAPGPAQPWIAEELEALNEAYERVFGFRFVIFVAGRPRSEIVPILERSLRDERVSELRRGIDDVVFIAADRLATLRT